MPEPTKETIEKLVRDYLKEGTLMQVATCIDNQPWVAHVWYCFDNDLNLYFISGNYRRHSKEIRKQEKVAGGIVVPHLEGCGQKTRGLTFQGSAKELDTLPSLKALSIYLKRWPKATMYITNKKIRENITKVRFYKITPSLFVLFDEVNFPDQSRQELPWSKN